MSKAHLITVHGINTPELDYFKYWIPLIPGHENLSIHPVKWESHNWNDDLLNIFMFKTWRDEQIQKVMDRIQSINNEPIVLLSHSFGTVWAYKAWRRLGNSLKSPIWSIMGGAALGGTNLPFAGPYIDLVKEEFKTSPPPDKVERLFNLYNPDDYVSSRIYMNRMENFRIDVGGFNPGFNEHSLTNYLKSMEFHHIMQMFWEKYG